MRQLIGPILFMLSSGLYFNEKGKRNVVALGVAGMLAIIATYFTVEQAIQRILAHLENKSDSAAEITAAVVIAVGSIIAAVVGVFVGTRTVAQSKESSSNGNMVGAVRLATNQVSRWADDENPNPLQHTRKQEQDRREPPRPLHQNSSFSTVSERADRKRKSYREDETIEIKLLGLAIMLVGLLLFGFLSFITLESIAFSAGVHSIIMAAISMVFIAATGVVIVGFARVVVDVLHGLHHAF